MPAVLVKRAIDQARNRDPLVKAMALLHGARVLAAVDKNVATQIFAEGVSTVERLTLPAHQMENVLNEAVRLGAHADPLAAAALFRRLPAGHHHFPRRSAGTMLVQALAQAGNFAVALSLLDDLNCELGGAHFVVDCASEPAVQRRAMAAARERWRAHRIRSDTRRNHFAEQEFFHLFSLHWRRLEAAEQEGWLDEILQALETDPDQATHARFGTNVDLHSKKDTHLFQILNVVRALKSADQVEAILRNHPNVIKAAEVYPLGLESLMAEPRPIPEGSSGEFKVAGAGSGSDGRLLAGSMAARRGDPSAVHDLAEAHRLYRQDTDGDDPNLAPGVFWPSCHAYREAVYWAGHKSGLAAEPLLAEIPNADLALLASIELAAGTLGLPQHSGVRMEHHPRRHRRV